MVLDAKLAALIAEFRIEKPEDWCKVHPESITVIDNIGPKTLDHLRLMLANRGLTLRGDQTPQYWQENLGTLRGATQIAGTDISVVTPFTILIDSDEKQPFSFLGLRADADQQNRPLIVRTAKKHLGNSHGDYSVDGLEGWVHVERKSMADAQSTVLGWGDRRQQFVKTLEYLAEIPFGSVVVECTRGMACKEMPSNGKKTSMENARIFFRQVLAWESDYRVPWVFCDDRRMAEVATYQTLRRQWRHDHARKKRAAIDAAMNEIQSL